MQETKIEIRKAAGDGEMTNKAQYPTATSAFMEKSEPG